MAIPMETLSLELLSLPAASRAELAARLIASLDEAEDSEVEAAWIAEAERRLQEIRDGKVELQDAEEVLRAARAILEK